jgi:hypothetical protein
MDVKELTLDEIRATIRDMRYDAQEKRKRADKLKRDQQHSRAFALMGEAIVIEHWCNRLANAMAIGG